ncbi:Hypothetical predicted protein, partial [Pelobates cultripes]
VIQIETLHGGISDNWEGVLNGPLDLMLDSSSEHSSILERLIREIRKALRDMRLVDCWGPTTRQPKITPITQLSTITMLKLTTYSCSKKTSHSCFQHHELLLL